jgi:hypothetical protein
MPMAQIASYEKSPNALLTASSTALAPRDHPQRSSLGHEKLQQSPGDPRLYDLQPNPAYSNSF